MTHGISPTLTTEKERMDTARSFRLGPQFPPDRTRLAQAPGCLVVTRTIKYPLTPPQLANSDRCRH